MHTESFTDPETYEIDSEEFVGLMRAGSNPEKALDAVENSISYLHEGQPIQLEYERIPNVSERPDEILYRTQVGRRAFSGKVEEDSEKGEYLTDLTGDKEELDDKYYPDFNQGLRDEAREFVESVVSRL